MKTEVLGEDLSQCHIGHEKYHAALPGIEYAGGGKPATYRLSYGKAYKTFLIFPLIDCSVWV
jgi:hypothetical protein